MVSRNIVFRENQLFKDLVQEKGKEAVLEHENSDGSVRNSVEIGQGSGAVSEVQEEGGVVQKWSEAADKATDETEGLRNYQLARDRVRREIVKPARYTEVSAISVALSVAEEIDCKEPRDYEEAIKSQHWEKSNAAMDDEFESLEENKTWNLDDLPEDKKAIGCKWLYKKKPGIPSVEPPRYKARLVAKSYSQREGVDYQEIFVPVVKHVSIRLMLSMVVDKDLELEKLDVKTAFYMVKLMKKIIWSSRRGTR